VSSRLLVFLGLVGGALLGLVASAQPWWRATGTGVDVPFTGTESSAGLSQALIVVALAGTLLVLTLRRRGRQVVAILLALLGAGIAVTGALRLRPSGSAVRNRLRQTSLADSYALTSSVWPFLYAGAGMLIFGAAVLMAVRSPHWSQRTDRFQRPGVPGTGDASDPAALWKAIDAGIDPTVSPRRSGRRPDAGPAAEPPDPDVHGSTSGDRMGTNQNADRRTDFE
jgi:uncharacterized membrane protein (TIGR02234 family)